MEAVFDHHHDEINDQAQFEREILAVAFIYEQWRLRKESATYSKTPKTQQQPLHTAYSML